MSQVAGIQINGMTITLQNLKLMQFLAGSTLMFQQQDLCLREVPNYLLQQLIHLTSGKLTACWKTKMFF